MTSHRTIGSHGDTTHAVLPRAQPVEKKTKPPHESLAWQAQRLLHTHCLKPQGRQLAHASS
eukprot:6773820-Alexandrium_andersonii.AAC.1